MDFLRCVSVRVLAMLRVLSHKSMQSFCLNQIEWMISCHVRYLSSTQVKGKVKKNFLVQQVIRRICFQQESRFFIG